MEVGNLRQTFCKKCRTATPGHTGIQVYVPSVREEIHSSPYFMKGRYNGSLSEQRRTTLQRLKFKKAASVPWWMEQNRIIHRLFKKYL